MNLLITVYLLVSNILIFYLQCISSEKHLISETVSTKKHGQVYMYRKGYHDPLLVSFSETTHAITTATHTGEQIYSPSSKIRKDFPKSYGRHLWFHTK